MKKPFKPSSFFPWLVISSPILSAPTTTEVIAERNLNHRLWRRTEMVEVLDPATRKKKMEERVSQIIEVGDFLCYRDPETGSWKPASPRWVKTESGFAAAGVGYKASVQNVSGTGITYLPAGEDAEVQLQLLGLYMEDGGKREQLRALRSGVPGTILANDQTRLIFPAAL